MARSRRDGWSCLRGRSSTRRTPTSGSFRSARASGKSSRSRAAPRRASSSTPRRDGNTPPTPGTKTRARRCSHLSAALRASAVIRDNVRHDIPSRSDCKSCHEGSPSRILGFSALQLSVDRDPNAPHAEPLADDRVTLRTLVARGLLRGLPATSVGWRAAHRGEIPNGARRARVSAQQLRPLPHPLGRAREPETLTAVSVGRAARPLIRPRSRPRSARSANIVPSSWEAPGDRLVAGQPDRSVLAFRMASRNPVARCRRSAAKSSTRKRWR